MLKLLVDCVQELVDFDESRLEECFRPVDSLVHHLREFDTLVVILLGSQVEFV